jgi:hypothetical protein
MNTGILWSGRLVEANLAFGADRSVLDDLFGDLRLLPHGVGD